MNMITQEDLQRYARLREHVVDAEKVVALRVKELEYEGRRLSSMLMDGIPVEPGIFEARFLVEDVAATPIGQVPCLPSCAALASHPHRTVIALLVTELPTDK